MAIYERYDNKTGTKRLHYRKRVTLPDGRKVRVAGTPSQNTKRAAEDAERAHIARMLNPPPVAKPALARHRMADVLDRFLTDYVAIANNKESERTSKATAIGRYLRPELGELYLDEVTAEVVATLTAKLHRTLGNRRDDAGELATLSAKYVKNILQTLRKVLRWAEEMGWADKIPKVRMPRVDQEEVHYLELVELAALIEVAGAESMWLAAVLLAADAGLRQGELRALKWTDINGVTNQVVIATSRWRNTESSTKSRKPRSVPISKRLAAALHANRATKLRGPYVISRQDGKPYGAEHMNDTIARLVRGAKLTDCTWHTLRHTFCTRLAMLGVPVTTIQKLAGHANIATTMRYMHVVSGATDDAISMLDNERARGGHGDRAARANDSELSEVVTL